MQQQAWWRNRRQRGRRISLAALLAGLLCLVAFFALPASANPLSRPPGVEEVTGRVINASEVNIRKSPTRESRSLGVVRRREPLTIHGKNLNCRWYNVTTQDGRTGWVFSDYVGLPEGVDCQEIPFINATDPPTATIIPTPALRPTTTLALPTTAIAPSVTPQNIVALSQNPLLRWVLIGGAVGLVLAALWFMTGRRRTQPAPAGQITQAAPQSVAAALPPTARPQAGVAYLTANTPGQSPALHPINKDMITLGRDPGCEIQVDGAHATVSRRHAQIVRQGEEYILVDLNSASGVYLDNVRVGRNRLRDGVVFSLGQAVSFTFHLNPGA